MFLKMSFCELRPRKRDTEMFIQNTTKLIFHGVKTQKINETKFEIYRYYFYLQVIHVNRKICLPGIPTLLVFVKTVLSDDVVNCFE